MRPAADISAINVRIMHTPGGCDSKMRPYARGTTQHRISKTVMRPTNVVHNLSFTADRKVSIG